MFSNVSQLFHWSQNEIPRTEKQILICDHLSADGSFLLSYFINQYIKSKQIVILVGLEQSFFHYMAISRKMGINLKEEHDQKRFIYINALSSPYHWTDPVFTETNQSKINALQDIANAYPFSIFDSNVFHHSMDQNKIKGKDQFLLQSWYQQIQDLILQRSNEGKKVCLLIDNLSALNHVVNESQIYYFLHYMKIFLAKWDQEQDGLDTIHEPIQHLVQGSSTIVALIHSDSIRPSFINYLKHQSSLVMDIKGFKTGHFVDQDGQISISRPLRRQQDDLTQRVFHFKVLDNAIRIHPVSW